MKPQPDCIQDTQNAGRLNDGKSEPKNAGTHPTKNLHSVQTSAQICGGQTTPIKQTMNTTEPSTEAEETTDDPSKKIAGPPPTTKSEETAIQGDQPKMETEGGTANAQESGNMPEPVLPPIFAIFAPILPPDEARPGGKSCDDASSANQPPRLNAAPCDDATALANDTRAREPLTAPFSYAERGQTPAGYVCTLCKSTGIRLYRHYQPLPAPQEFFCRARANVLSPHPPKCETEDVFGAFVAAVPTEDGITCWAAKRIPFAAFQWWLSLPLIAAAKEPASSSGINVGALFRTEVEGWRRPHNVDANTPEPMEMKTDAAVQILLTRMKEAERRIDALEGKLRRALLPDDTPAFGFDYSGAFDYAHSVVAWVARKLGRSEYSYDGQEMHKIPCPLRSGGCSRGSGSRRGSNPTLSARTDPSMRLQNCSPRLKSNGNWRRSTTRNVLPASTNHQSSHE